MIVVTTLKEANTAIAEMGGRISIGLNGLEQKDVEKHIVNILKPSALFILDRGWFRAYGLRLKDRDGKPCYQLGDIHGAQFPIDRLPEFIEDYAGCLIPFKMPTGD